MSTNNLDKRNLYEMITIFKQLIYYQNHSQKDQLIPDITHAQQEKINKFLNAYSTHFKSFLMGDDLNQHFDFFRILSKEIKVFYFSKGEKFRQSHFDGLYIILKGSIEQTKNEKQEENASFLNLQKSRSRNNKQKLQDQNRMKQIVNVVISMNRLKGSFNFSNRNSLQKSQDKSQIDEGQICRTSTFNRVFQKKQESGQISPTNSEQGGIQIVKREGNDESDSDTEFYQPRRNVAMASFQQRDSENQITQPQQYVGENFLSVKRFEYEPPAQQQRNVEEQSFQQSPQQYLTFSNCFDSAQKNLNIISSSPISPSTPKFHSIFKKSFQMNQQLQNPTEEIGAIEAIGAHLAQQQQEQNMMPGGSFINIQAYSPEESIIYDSSPRLHSFTPDLQSMGTFTLKQPFQYFDSSNKVHKIFYSGESLNLIQANFEEHKYATSDSEDCICLYISKKSMQRAFKEQVDQLRWKTSVLERVFANVPYCKILKLAYKFYEKSLYKNQFVYQIGDKHPFSFYIVKSGEVKIIEKAKKNSEENQEVSKNREQSSDSNEELTNQNQNQDDAFNANQRANQKNSSQKTKFQELQELCLKKLEQKSAAWKKKIEEQVLCYLGAQEVFGIEELVKKQSKRRLGAQVSSSKCQVFVLQEDQLMNFYQTESDSINQWFKQKEMFYSQQRNLFQKMSHKISQGNSNNLPVPKQIKKECKYLFQEDEQTFDKKMFNLKEKKYISQSGYLHYKKYHDQSRSSSRENSQDSQQSQQQQEKQSQSQSILQQKQIQLQKQGGTFQQQVNEATKSTTSNLKKLLFQQSTSSPRKISFLHRPSVPIISLNQIIQEDEDDKIEKKEIGFFTSRNQMRSKESSITKQLNQDSPKKSSRLLSTHASENKLSNTFTTCPIDLNNSKELNKTLSPNSRKKNTSRYISNTSTTIAEGEKVNNLHLGKLYSMVNYNQVIAKEQLKRMGGGVNFKKPIFESLRSDNLKQALKYVHQKKMLLNKAKLNQDSNRDCMTDRAQTTRADKYKLLIQKINLAQSEKDSQQQLLKTASCSKFSLSSQYSAKALNSSRTQNTLLTTCSVPIIATDQTCSTVTSQQIANSPSNMNIHMKQKRIIEKEQEPHSARPFSRVELRNKKQKFKVATQNDEESQPDSKGSVKQKLVNKTVEILCLEEGKSFNSRIYLQN